MVDACGQDLRRIAFDTEPIFEEMRRMLYTMAETD
jgi:hypothetical protein